MKFKDFLLHSLKVQTFHLFFFFSFASISLTCHTLWAQEDSSEFFEFRGPHLPALSLSDSFVEPIVGHRPSRSAGLRIEKESFGSRTVIHAYGHGGAGLTLAFGTADFAIDLAASLLPASPRVLIVGGGVIGFTIAYELRERGYQNPIEIYSAEFFPHNVSRIAGGLWSPVSFSMSEESLERKNEMLRFSFQRYEELSAAGWPVIPLPLFVTKKAQEKSGLEDFARLNEIFEIKPFSRLPIKGVREGGYAVETFLIDTPRYLTRLISELTLRRNVQTVTHRFESMEEVLSLTEEGVIIFNATGLGARELVGDADLYPTRGDLLYVRAHPGFDNPLQQMRHMAFYGEEGTDYAFPRVQDLVIGGTFLEFDESTQVNLKTCAEKLESFNRFYGLRNR